MTIQLKALFFLQGFVSSVHWSQLQAFLMNLVNPTTSLKWVCVCSPTLFLLLCKRYYEEQVLTLTLYQPRKVISSFHIREMGIIWSLDHLTFLRRNYRSYFWLSENTIFTWKVSEAYSCPPESMMSPYKYICFQPSW